MRINGWNTTFFILLHCFVSLFCGAAWSLKWREMDPCEFLSFVCAWGDPTISSMSLFALRKGVSIFHRVVQQPRCCSPWLEGTQRTSQALPKASLWSPGAAQWGGWWWNSYAVELGGGKADFQGPLLGAAHLLHTLGSPPHCSAARREMLLLVQNICSIPSSFYQTAG